MEQVDYIRDWRFGHGDLLYVSRDAMIMMALMMASLYIHRVDSHNELCDGHHLISQTFH